MVMLQWLRLDQAVIPVTAPVQEVVVFCLTVKEQEEVVPQKLHLQSRFVQGYGLYWVPLQPHHSP